VGVGVSGQEEFVDEAASDEFVQSLLPPCQLKKMRFQATLLSSVDRIAPMLQRDHVCVNGALPAGRSWMMMRTPASVAAVTTGPGCTALPITEPAAAQRRSSSA
jgi:hypothetical protein